MIGPSLQAESDKLARSWMQHDAGMLRDYLVAGVEDPRRNVQSMPVSVLTIDTFG